MTKRMFRGDAPAVAQVTRITPPEGTGEIALTILGTGRELKFATWDATAVAAAWNASRWPEFVEATASVDGADVLLTSKTAGKPFYLAATVHGNAFGNEVQTITPVAVTGGLAEATWLGQTTDPFNPATATAATWQALFEALADIVDADELVWTGPAGGPWRVEFTGRYAQQNVPPITIDASAVTGGTAARNEIQRLFLQSGSTLGSFFLRRSDTIETTSELTPPVSADAIETALAEIAYTTTCTGGPLTGSGGTELTQLNYFAGSFWGSTLRSFNADGDGIALIGDNAGEAATGLLQFALPIDQGATITSAILKPIFQGGFPLNGITVSAEDTDNGAWPADAATAAAAVLTTAATNLNVSSLGGVYAVDVTDIVQEVVNRAGFAKGNKILFYLVPPPTTVNARMILNAGAMDPLSPIKLETITDGEAITIEWTGSDAETDIPQLLVVPSGGYTTAPGIVTVQDGAAAMSAALLVATETPGGESLIIRDDIRSRGPNHYDDPSNWESDDETFAVPEDGDSLFIESGNVDLLWGLSQRCTFIALPVANKLRATSPHHWWEGQAVQLQSTETLPAGLAANTRYYVVSVDGPNFQLSATRGGDPIDITDAGAGIHTAGVKLTSGEIQARWIGKIGLPRLNKTGALYWEYRERYLAVWCDKWKIGTGEGGGSSRINIDTGTLQTKLQAIASAGQVESGVNAILWRGNHASNDIEVMTADLGIAIFPEEEATFDELRQRGGSFTLGRNVTGGSIDATAGSRIIMGATIAGQQVMY